MRKSKTARPLCANADSPRGSNDLKAKARKSRLNEAVIASSWRTSAGDECRASAKRIASRRCRDQNWAYVSSRDSVFRPAQAMSLRWLVAVLAVASPLSSIVADGAGGVGYRIVPLTVPQTGKGGFTLLAPSATG